MRNIPTYKVSYETRLKMKLAGAKGGASQHILIGPRKDGSTEVRFSFHEMKDAPKGKVYTLWAVSPDNKFVRLGQIVNVKGQNEAEIKSQTTLPDFGLLITMEDAGDRASPAGPKLAIVEIIK